MGDRKAITRVALDTRPARFNPTFQGPVAGWVGGEA